MLDYFREGAQGPTLRIIVGLIIVSFVLTGAFQVVTISAGNAAAEVNGVDIEERDVQRSSLQIAAQLQQQRVPAQQIEAQARSQAIEGLVVSELLNQSADDLRLGTSVSTVDKSIANDPSFQVDGIYSEDQHRRVLAQLGYSARGFSEAQLRQLTISQLQNAILNSDFVLESEVNAALVLQEQTRDYQYQLISLDAVKADLKISAADVDAYYQANKNRFLSEEKVSVEYIEYTTDALSADIEVSDEDIKTAYQRWVAEQKSDEVREVAHILVTENVDETIVEIQSKLEAGETFEALAEQYSQDFATATDGGFFGQVIDGFDDKFNEAANALVSVGDISAAVESNYGTHLVKLVSLDAKEIDSLADKTAELTADLKLEGARKVLNSRRNEIDDVLFTSAESLTAVAELLNIEIKTSELMTQTAGSGIAEISQVRSAAFSDLVLKDGLNSEAIIVNQDTMIAVRLAAHQKAEVQALSQVTAEIESTLLDQQARTAVQAKAEAALAAIQTGTATTDDWTLVEKAARFEPGINQNVTQAVFKLAIPADNKLSAQTVASYTGDVYVVNLLKMNSGDVASVEANLLEQTRGIVSQIESMSAFTAYYRELRSDADISVSNRTVAY
jgi:peptidyl-prolyl cis-trans isomerase D